MKQIFQERFDSACKSTKKKANKDYYNFYTSELKELNHYNKVNKLSIELNIIESKIDADPHPYYVDRFKCKELLFTDFENRCNLLKVDETEELKNSIYLGYYKQRIFKTLLILKKTIPEYTFHLFKQGVICPYFNSYIRWHNVDLNNYLQIRNHQISNLSEIVTLSSKVIIENLIESLSNLKDPFIQISNELNIIENELEKNITENHSIIKIFSKMLMFRNIKLNIFNENNLKHSFKVFNSELPFSQISNNLIECFKKETKNNNVFPISNETVFFIINRIKIWLQYISINNNITSQFELSKLTNDEVNIIRKEALLKSNLKISEIVKNTPNKNQIDYFKRHLEEYRNKFNDFEDHTWFYLFDQNEENLNLHYIGEVLSKKDFSNVNSAFSESILILNVLNHILISLENSYEQANLDLQGLTTNCTSVRGLLNKMILNKQIFNKLLLSEDRLLYNLEMGSLPLIFHIINSAFTLNEVFEIAINNFIEIIKNINSSEKKEFILSRIKELKLDNFRMKYFDNIEMYKPEGINHRSVFLEYLELEADYIRDSNDFNFHPEIRNNSSTFIKKRISFSYIYYKSRLSQLTDLMKFLIQHELISNKTDIKNFRNIFSGKEVQIKIIWTGNASEFSYFIKFLIHHSDCVENLKHNHWDIATNCFEKMNHIPFEQNKLRTLKKPAKYKILERAINLL